MLTVLAGRIWRRLNRLASRAWLSTQVDDVNMELVTYGRGHAAWWALADMAPGSVAYCGGVGRNATFDFDLAERLGAEVHSFDPTPGSIAYMARENRGRVEFHPWGLLDKDATVRFHAPSDRTDANWFVDNLHGTDDYFEAECWTIGSIMRKLGHDEIALLKIDIEGSWGQVLHDMLEHGIHPQLLCVEFDSPAPLHRVRRTVRALKAAGYKLARRKKENCAFIKVPPDHSAAACQKHA